MFLSLVRESRSKDAIDVCVCACISIAIAISGALEAVGIEGGILLRAISLNEAFLQEVGEHGCVYPK